MTTDPDLDSTLEMLSGLSRIALEALAFHALRAASKHEAAVALAEAQLEIEAAVAETEANGPFVHTDRWSRAVQDFARTVSAYREATA